MPRQVRIEYDGAINHVMARGNCRMAKTRNASTFFLTPLCVKSNGEIIDYEYDFMSRRIGKNTTPAVGGTGSNVTFVYHGWNLCAEYTGTTLKKTYTWGMDLSGSMQGAGGVGGLLAIEEKTGTHQGIYYPLYDGNGNITQIIEKGTIPDPNNPSLSEATVKAHYEYDPFGNLTENQDKDGTGYHAVNPFKFSTKYHDQETGLYYYGYRYYDPVTGRWLNRDPVEENEITEEYILYAFVKNNGLSHLDRLGEQTLNVTNKKN